ncbi:proton-conducting transporter membrane subunit [Marinilactibacillus sp. XAAS-LB27]|uniref:complex I subunit 5 family protein n=1 Tax=Marinilactibacillus sp. XAAS-LB27 TaxID=3114538 RepID=UPI002E180B97|nr:proton-conducting transporter membrane subunit [Marinilactibacillus sp. XAAS-LB27]
MLYSLVLAPIIFGLLAYVVNKKIATVLLLVFQFLFGLYAFYVFFTVNSSGALLWNAGGYPDGVALSLYADPISSVMVLFTAIFYFAFLVYAIRQTYFKPLFYFMFMVLEGLMMGLFLSSDLFNIFVFLEVSTVVVSILIMINKEKQAIYDGMIYFFVNVIGTAFLLFGIAMIYRTFGMLDIRMIQEAMSQIEDPKSVILPYAFMMTTVSLKTAVTPLFSWLPKAHGTPSAPPVVSAILSGLYIKSGVYLFIRFSNMYASAIDMHEFFFWIGFITSTVGFVMALGQHDIKLILAYHTVSQVGLIMMGLNMASEIAFWGAVYHIFNHAIFKSTLFLTAGLIYDEYDTRDVYQIRGLFKRMPLVAIATALAMLGITGAPFFNGSISKYMIAHGTYDYSTTILLNIVNLGTTMSFIKYATMLFGKNPKEGRAKIDIFALSASLFMGVASLITGIFGERLSEFLFNFEVHVNPEEYIQKGIVYVLMIIAGIGFYNGIIKHGGILTRIGHLELTFNATITAMVGYFILLVVYLNFLY